MGDGTVLYIWALIPTRWIFAPAGAANSSRGRALFAGRVGQVDPNGCIVRVPGKSESQIYSDT